MRFNRRLGIFTGLTSAILAVAACTVASPTASVPSSPSDGKQQACAFDDADIAWNGIDQEKRLTQVFTYQHGIDKKPAMVESHPGLQVTITGTELNDAWLPILTEDLATAKGILAQPVAGPPAIDGKELFGLVQQKGKYIGYSGGTAVTATFSITCKEIEPVSGTLNTWTLPSSGVLFCAITPPADSFAHLARKYC